MIHNIICYLSPVPGVGISEPYDFEAEGRSSRKKEDGSTRTASLSDAKEARVDTEEGV